MLFTTATQKQYVIEVEAVRLGDERHDSHMAAFLARRECVVWPQ
jgi:hypothetical protein